jgi:hypothetical protein
MDSPIAIENISEEQIQVQVSDRILPNRREGTATDSMNRVWKSWCLLLAIKLVERRVSPFLKKAFLLSNDRDWRRCCFHFQGASFRCTRYHRCAIRNNHRIDLLYFYPCERCAAPLSNHISGSLEPLSDFNDIESTAFLVRP